LDNIDDKQLATLREAAAIWLKADDGTIEKNLAAGNLLEVKDDD
jgi:hypothetical protein